MPKNWRGVGGSDGRYEGAGGVGGALRPEGQGNGRLQPPGELRHSGLGDWVADAHVALDGSRADLDAYLSEHFAGKSINDRTTARGNILRFRDGIEVGDVVVMPLRGSQTASGWVAIGRVRGPMECDPTWPEGTRLRRRIDWLRHELHSDGVESGLRDSVNSPHSVFRVGVRNSLLRLLHLAEYGIDPGPDGPSALSLSGDEADVAPDAEHDIPEGARKRVSVNRYERDPEARGRCLEHHGYQCQACGMTFESRYGKIGRGFIHVHHLVPLAQIADHESHTVDPVKDLVPVCPNCHAMLHRPDGPPLTVSELSEAMRHANERTQAK